MATTETKDEDHMNIFKKIFAAAAMLFAMMTANAAAVVSYGDLAPPGFYNGSGSLNGGFWVTTDLVGNSTIELGLRIKDRDTGAAANGNNLEHIYQVGTGLCVGGNGCTAGTRAKGSYEFSVHVTDNSQEPQTNTVNQAITYMLGVDRDPTVNENMTWVDPQTYWNDNGVAPTGFGFQNSENFVFPNTPGGAISPFLEGLFTFRLRAMRGEQVLSETWIVEQVGKNIPVPEPTSSVLALAALGILGVTLRHKASAGRTSQPMAA